jgi:hypothetical protein
MLFLRNKVWDFPKFESTLFAFVFLRKQKEWNF